MTSRSPTDPVPIQPVPSPIEAVPPARPPNLDAPALSPKARWLAFAILGLGTLMNVLDTTIANIALKPIGADLGFSQAGLAWVVNAYLLTFGGFLLLAGRMGDLYGSRRLFLIGLSVFTLASLWCGFAHDQVTLIVARAVQGLGAAVVAAVSLGIIMGLFPDGPERAKAMGIFAFIASGGGALGAIVGGYITAHFDWHWNFLINIPIGIVVFFGTLWVVPATKGTATGRLDVAGAILVTAALVLAVYGVIQAKDEGWLSTTTLLRFAGALLLLGIFVVVEKRVKNPLVPLALFKSRNIVVTNLAGVLWAAAMFAWFFLMSLYMQRVLVLDAQATGFAFVPADAIMAAFSVGLSARMVAKFGIRKPMVAGLLLAALGLLLFARAPVAGDLWIDVLPGMLILGVGAGMAFNPLFLAAMADAKPEEAGLASGLVNTSFMMGGALGLAALASLAASRTTFYQGRGFGEVAALNGGYHAAFLAGAVCAAVGALLCAFLLRIKDPAPGEAPAPAPMH